MTRAKHSKPVRRPWYERYEWQVFPLCLLVFLVYAKTIGSSFHFDDFSMLRDPSIRERAAGLELFRAEQTRPLTYLTFHWNYLLGGEDPRGYHLANLLLHLANVSLVLALARRFLTALPAFLAAALFALHPVQTEAVDYVFARSTLLCSSLALGAVWFYFRERWAWSASMFGLSLLAKEETIALPAFLLLLDYFRSRRPKWSYYWPLGTLALLSAIRLLHQVSSAKSDTGIGGPSRIYLLAQGNVIWTYLRLFVWPSGLSLEHDVPLAGSALSWIALMTLLGALAYRAWRRQAAATWMLGFFVLLSPSSSFVAQADLMFEHRMYFPMAALTIAAGSILLRFPQRLRTWTVAALVAATVYATAERNPVWKDEATLWTDAMLKAPHKPRPYLALAQAYMRDDPTRSMELLRRGLQQAPDNAELQTNYGAALLSEGRSQEALVYFRKAIGRGEGNADQWSNMGAAYFNSGDLSQSIDCFQHALKLDLCNFSARRNLMLALASENSKAAAFKAGAVPGNCRLPDEEMKALSAFRAGLH